MVLPYPELSILAIICQINYEILLVSGKLSSSETGMEQRARARSEKEGGRDQELDKRLGSYLTKHMCLGKLADETITAIFY